MARPGGKDRGLYQVVNVHGRKRWYVRIAVHGQMQRFGQPDGFRSKGEAEQFRDRLRAAVRERRYFPSAQQTEATMAELVKRYLESLDGKRASLRDIRRHLHWWSDRLGTRPVLSLDVFDIEGGLQALRARGSGPVTANHYAKSLRAMMRKLVQPSTWVYDLWQKVELYPVHDRVMPTYTRAQLDQLFTRLPVHDALLVYLNLLIGIRQALYFALRWEWVRWDQHVLQLPSFKRQQAFTLPLSGEARAILEVFHEEQARPADGWIFPSRWANGSASRANTAVHRDPHNWYTRTFKPILVELGMPDLTFHALRRTWATVMGERVPQRILQVCGNWKDGKVVERYCQPYDASLRAAMESVADSLGTARELPATKHGRSEILHKILKKTALAV